MKKPLHQFASFGWMVCVGMLLATSPRVVALDNGLTLTPPMGWNSWNKFGCDVSEDLIKSTADAMVSNGVKDAGYQYVIIDDCWQVSRDSTGNIVADPKRFPSGIKALADYVHAKGLKFGLYSCAGTNTCAGRPGSRGHESQDALQYAAWGVDYLKYDWCNHGDESAEVAYGTMRDALKHAGRPVVFSICEWGNNKPWLWAGNVGNLWRTTGDIHDCWDCKEHYWLGWTRILDQQDGLESFAGPGHWNDPDMLEVGNGGMSTTEYKSHFTLWCILAAPLIAGNDMRNMPPEIKDILTDGELIAVDQDSLGLQGRRVRKNGNQDVWMKRLHGDSRAVALLNRGSSDERIIVSWEELGYPGPLYLSVRDLWAKNNLGKFAGGFTASVPSHSVVALKVSP